MTDMRNPMNPLSLTLFAVPKAFTGDMAWIQGNAIESWTRLNPRPDIFLMGRDQGTDAMARKLGVGHIPDIETSELGTPLMHSIFQRAEACARTSWLAYINADCLLLDDFTRALAMLPGELAREGIPKFLLSSQRVEIDIRNAVDFSDPGWQAHIYDEVARDGVLDHKTAIELLLFSKGLFRDIPPFAIGRPCWDNWMVWFAWQSKTPIIDATEAFRVVHQCHDYGHVTGGWRKTRQGDEAQRNVLLARGRFMSLDLACTHVLNKAGLAPGRTPDRGMRNTLVKRRLDRGLEEFNRSRYNEALDYFDDALSRSGSLAVESLHLIRALCLERLGNREEALQALAQELAVFPENAQARQLLAKFTGDRRPEPDE
jgi:tetratricopeptide (TPR) repeat protein